jgi:3-oxoacyl-[acyl-carrier protein] reductase
MNKFESVESEFEGKVALVTAASQGLGYACALRLAQAGCSVAICARREGVLETAKDEIKASSGSHVLAKQADLMNADSLGSFVDEAYARFGRIDILIANSGHIPYGGLFELEEQQWYEAIELLLMSFVRLSRRVIPIMQKQKAGDIALIASSAAKEPSPHLLLSNVLRVAVVSLAKTLSKELAPDNIRVNTVTPGYFDTGRVRRRIDTIVEQEAIDRIAAAQKVAGAIPMGRIGLAEELAELVVFLVSRRAEFLTGATIQIDGGKARGLF